RISRQHSTVAGTLAPRRGLGDNRPMRNPSRSIRRVLGALLIVACLGMTHAAPATPAGQHGSHAEQAAARQKLADLRRATYTLGHGSDLRLLLGDEDVARIARALVYSQYFQRDRVQRVEKLMGDLARLQELESSIAAQQQTLQATKAQRQQQAQQLARQRAARQKLAAETDAKYKDQAQRLAAMKQNAQSLNQLLDKLQKAIDEAAAPQRGQPPPSRSAD